MILCVCKNKVLFFFGLPFAKKNKQSTFQPQGVQSGPKHFKHASYHPQSIIIGTFGKRLIRSVTRDFVADIAFISLIEPKSIKEACSDEYWMIAMQDSLNQFVRNDVWELVPPPTSQK